MGNKAAVDRLDYVTSGSKMVAASISATKRAPALVEQRPYIHTLRYGAGEWNRTIDLRFTKPLALRLVPNAGLFTFLGSPLFFLGHAAPSG